MSGINDILLARKAIVDHTQNKKGVLGPIGEAPPRPPASRSASNAKRTPNRPRDTVARARRSLAPRAQARADKGRPKTPDAQGHQGDAASPRRAKDGKKLVRSRLGKRSGKIAGNRRDKSTILSGSKGRNSGGESRKLSIQELHTIRISSLLNNKVITTLFPPRDINVLRKTRILKGAARKKARH